MNGSEKQIAYVLDIVKRAQVKLNEMQESIAAHGEKSMYAGCSDVDVLTKRIEWMNAQENASAVISMATGDNWETIGLNYEN